MESDLHLQQMVLLIQCLDWLWQDRNDYYACGNLTIYYSDRQLKSEQFRGPDFFVVLDTERKPRNSWVVWQENGQYPNVIVEVLSKTTAKTDRGLKRQIYQNVFRTPEYFWFDPRTVEFVGLHLVSGQYEPITPTEQGWLWSQQLQLFLGVEGGRLRWLTPEGVLVPTPQEAAHRAQQQAETAQQRAEQLAAKLRELGIDPDTVA